LRADRFVARWAGVALALVGVVATVWLAATGRLELYIHPRYTVFTIVMAVLGGALAIAALATGLRSDARAAGSADAPGDPHAHDDDGHDHDHDHDGPDPAKPVRARIGTVVRIAIVAGAAAALLALPPATLSASTLQSRDLTTSGQALESTDTAALVGGDTTAFSVKDWASLLRQAGPEAVLGQRAEVVGYVLDSGDGDVFHLARLTVTCCAVDAQPVGVPVLAPEWADEFETGSWVAVEGVFVENPDAASSIATVLEPESIEQVDEPEQPYVF
jgi:uncharacterized repeat protein (TIGR03943 family)